MSIVLGVVVGLILGLTGAGGSIFAVPLLMAGLGWPLAEAAPIALLAVAAAAALGSYLAWRGSFVRYRAATLMSVVGVLTSPLGLHAANRLPAAALSLMFAAILAVAAIRLALQTWRKADDAPASSSRICKFDPVSGHLIWTWTSGAVIAAIGAVTGFLSGLLGVGGGFFIVPALRGVTELSMQSAVATSLMTIALTSLGTVASAALIGRDIPLIVALPFVAGSLLGMAGGRWLAPKIDGLRLQQGFALLMLIVAAGMAMHGLHMA
jgi:uncharacterized membrane protein YfcA